MKTENGEENIKATVSPAKKRKVDDDDNSSAITDNKAKIATTCKYVAGQVKIIWKIISDEEVDLLMGLEKHHLHASR
jgi:hypothetical protein